jgi:hypothetical protein
MALSMSEMQVTNEARLKLVNATTIPARLTTFYFPVIFLRDDLNTATANANGQNFDQDIWGKQARPKQSCSRRPESAGEISASHLRA